MRVKNEIDDDEKGKLFVGGLSWETTQEALQRYFGRYGEVIDCVVMKNSESGRSRGFGFVTFSDPANVTHVLQNGPHQLDGRTIDPKPCNPRTLQKPKRASSYPKVFLGGLPSNVTETDLRSFFTRFGKVQEVVIMYDQEKKKSRGFGFLSFEDDDAVDRCVSEHFVNLNGKQVEIKKAEPRDSSNKMGGDNSWGPPQGGPQMGMGGGGMGMGGPNGQMGGPMSGPMGPMGPGNMMQGYQGWGNTQAQGYPGQWGPTSNQPPDMVLHQAQLDIKVGVLRLALKDKAWLRSGDPTTVVLLNSRATVRMALKVHHSLDMAKTGTGICPKTVHQLEELLKDHQALPVHRLTCTPEERVQALLHHQVLDLLLLVLEEHRKLVLIMLVMDTAAVAMAQTPPATAPIGVMVQMRDPTQVGEAMVPATLQSQVGKGLKGLKSGLRHDHPEDQQCPEALGTCTS
ncbi:hypothetical protein FOCC_FOCC016437 [Frankliniella occidentalis]|nr:hypothetical protein FOCC_FOCC016437 [Frankliniella occidentalis]